MNALLERTRRQASRAQGPAMIRGAANWQLASLVHAASRLAAAQIDRHKPGAPVQICIADGPALVVGLLAALELEAQAILVDGGTPHEERLRIAKTLGAGAMLTAESADRIAPSSFRWQTFEEIHRPDWADGEHAGVVKMTSGSSGSPRGVQVHTEALLADERQLRYSMGWTSEDRALAAIPLTHSYGLSSLLVPCLVDGLPLIFPDAPLPFRALVAAREHQATWFPSVPAALAALARHGSEHVTWPESIRCVQSAGAPLSAEDATRFRETFGRSIHAFYGSSETGGICYDREGGGAERGTVGEPIEGVRIELDEKDGRVTVASDAVAERTVPEHSPDLHEGRMRLGDLARFEGKELFLVGRTDTRIHLKGKKIDPLEIEAVLCEIDGVTEAAVFVCETTGGPQLRAVLASPRSLEVNEIRQHCRQRLAEYKRPRSLVVVAELPHTARGKLDRPALNTLTPQADC